MASADYGKGAAAAHAADRPSGAPATRRQPADGWQPLVLKGLDETVVPMRLA